MKLPLVAAAAVALVCVVASSNARAEGESAPDDGIAPAVPVAQPKYHLRDPDLEPKRRWYGWQTLMVDGLTLVTSPVGIGVPGLILGAPIVHLVHHRRRAAVVSFWMRAGGAAVVALWAGGTESRSGLSGFDAAVRAIGGWILVHSVATAIDAAVLAYDDRPSRPNDDAKRPTVRVAPSGGPSTTGGLTLGLSGTF